MTSVIHQIQKTTPRQTVQITFPTGDILEGAIETSLESFLNSASALRIIDAERQVIATICNGKLRELTYVTEQDAQIIPIFRDSSDGGRIYRRSLVLLLTTAVSELWNGVHVTVNYAVPDGGFYCELENRAPLTSNEVQQLEDKMQALVELNDPIRKQIVKLSDAIALFQQRGDHDKVRLLQFRQRDELTLYTLRERADYYYGYMVPSTGYLHLFKLIHVEGGFILQYPRQHNPNQLEEIKTFHKLSKVFHQADEWLEKMEVEDIGRLNERVLNNQTQELILVAEALHEQNIAYIASDICRKHTELGARVVLIAGPSSSGKTSFAKRLAIQLLANGLRPFTLEMDNYFVDRKLTPRDEHGDYDFESLHALNLPLFNEHLVQLMDGQKIRLPKFDFLTGTSEPGRLAQLKDNQIIILEGIHGLNPDLVPDIPKDAIFRVYVSAMTQLNIDNHNRVPTTDVRLLRRIVRDARTRGYSASDTLARWRSVRRGEKRNIFPYQENADALFNSALVYELAALKPLATPLLLQVANNTPQHIEANRLLSFLTWVQPLPSHQQAMIPDTSLLREFIGGAILDDYHPSEPIVENSASEH